MTTAGRFEVPLGGPYLMAHSVGCLPTAARAELETAMFTPWAAKGGDAWPLWLAAIDAFRAAIADLIGGHLSEVCPQANLSAGLFSLLSGMKREAGRDVLLASAHSFPSLGYVLQQAERFGFRVELLPEAADPGDAGVWDMALRSDVAAVLVMHVHSNTGVVAPVADIAALARDRGIVSIIDVAQSAGILPIDVRSWGATALIGSCVKWLCGGPGAGWLWVNPARTMDFTPANVGWFSHESPFEFDIRDFRYAPDARRFWGGSPAIASAVLATAGIRLMHETGIASILAHNRRLIARIADAAPTWAPQLDRAGRGGTLCLKPGDRMDEVFARLTAAGCHFDRRGETLRLSFHLWNDDNDADIVASCLKAGPKPH